MPNYRKKSTENLSAAKLLIDNNMFTASVHCSYYAGFQMSKYILAHYCNISYTRQEEEAKGKDSHFYIMNELSDSLSSINRFYYIDYNKYYNALKMLRKKADYSEIFITDHEAQKAYNYANQLITLLKSKYSIR